MDNDPNVLVNNSGHSNVAVTFSGVNNKVLIEPIKTLQSLIVDVRGDNNKVHIGSSPRYGHVRMIVQDRSQVIIGENTTIEQAYLLARDHTSIKVGKDCMISFQVDIRTSDAHGFYDLESGERLNRSQDIEINDHVWIGQGATLSKGASIGSGAVVGFRSYVQKTIVPANSVVAGSPARVVRTNIIWERNSVENIFCCPEEELDPYFLSNNPHLKRKRSALSRP